MVSVGLNVLLVLASFHFASPGHGGWRTLLPGSVIAGTGLTFLFSFGTVFLTRTVDNAGDTYGTFALVIGLLTWLNLIGSLLVWSAEVNSVLAGRRAMERTKLATKRRFARS
ncbi:MAG: YhjD/YihY/BrkB family envelope integrity protein [Ilumatobacteraceae bacterium]